MRTTHDYDQDLVEAAGETWQLCLYVAGQSPKSLRAFADLIEQPALARSDDILAIPTLVRRLPAPLRKIIGDLSDTERVLVGLRLQPPRAR